MIIKVTDNGTSKLLKTDAPVAKVSETYMQSSNQSEFLEQLEADGYSFEEVRPSISLDFDV